MTPWIKQRTTWLGIAAAAIGVVGVLATNGVIAPMWTSIAAAIVSGFGLVIKDTKNV